MSEETGFSFYSGMLSVGSCIGYLLTGSEKLTSEGDRVPVQYQNVYLDLFFCHCIDPHLLLLALDWAKFGLTVGSREQTAFLLVLVLYVVCWAVTMIAAREKPHRVDRCLRPWALAQALYT